MPVQRFLARLQFFEIADPSSHLKGTSLVAPIESPASPPSRTDVVVAEIQIVINPVDTLDDRCFEL